ncbi:hypothetical protein OAT67_04620 [Bacteriovoracaceae bacterium]|nr:hypothetical protein [Bacteriovoracaceae bacterium]
MTGFEAKALKLIAGSSLKLAYKGVMELRLRHMLKGLSEAIDTNDEKKLFGYLDSKFAYNNLYDFITKSINCSSEIGRYAIAKLYVEFHDLPTTKLPYNKIVLLKALSDLDDLDAQIFIEVYKFAKQKNKEPNKEGFVNLRVVKEEFDSILVNGIKVDYLHAMRLFNSLYSKGIVDEASAVIGQNTSVNYSFSVVSEAFYEYLVFGHEVFLSGQ